jgi:ABC-type phosphate transport system substrate-binding protein
MRSNVKRVAAVMAIGSALILGAALPAGASNDGTKGQDGLPDIVFSGGSDTTYAVQTRLGDLFNQAPGCTVVDGAGTTADSKYYPIAHDTNQGTNMTTCSTLNGDSKLNADHDVISQIYPTGSTAGINALIAGKWQIARSSRALKATEAPTNTGLAFARDGVAVVNFGATTNSFSTTGFTKLELQKLYGCQGPSPVPGHAATTGFYTWEQLWNVDHTPGTFTGSNAAHLVYPYGIQTSSGTYATFQTYLSTVDPSPTAAPGINCVKAPNFDYTVARAGTDYAFENDGKNVLTDPTKAWTDPSDVVWWSSFGVFNTYPFKRQGANFFNVDGHPIQNGTLTSEVYPIFRDLYHVVPSTTLAPVNQNATQIASQVALSAAAGPTGGQDGAARSFSFFLCEPSDYYTNASGTNGPAAALNPFTGDDYYTDITGAIKAEGFQRIITASQRNWGACNNT